jgi:hypothetical protein
MGARRTVLQQHGAIFSFLPQTGALVVPDNGVSKLNPFYPKTFR